MLVPRVIVYIGGEEVMTVEPPDGIDVLMRDPQLLPWASSMGGWQLVWVFQPQNCEESMSAV